VPRCVGGASAALSAGAGQLQLQPGGGAAAAGGEAAACCAAAAADVTAEKPANRKTRN